MSSNLKLRFFKQLGPRLIISFCAFFTIGSAIVFFIIYSFFTNTLEAKDHQIITSAAQEYAAMYRGRGIEGLKRIETDEALREEAAAFYIRLLNQNGETTFRHLPAHSKHFDFQQIETSLIPKTANEQWRYFPAQHEDDSLEVLTIQLGENNYLQVGRSSDEREDLADSLEQIFLVALLISLIFSAIAGTYLSKRVLRPIHDLISTITSIHTGDMEARVETTSSSEELEVLTRLFNEMLDRIRHLIRGMRETLDNVAHDLRTPMTRFRTLAEQRLSDVNSSTNDYREALLEAVENSDEILTMLNSLMDISEADAGAMNLRRESFLALPLLREIADLYELVAEEKGVELRVLENTDLVIDGDRTRIKQVVANLVDNAIKYTPRNGSVEIEWTTIPGKSVLIVRDTGIGIEPKDVSRIFERLFRADASRSQRGLGLGLSLVQAIVKGHGGSIEVDSRVNAGSVFKIYLPLH